MIAYADTSFLAALYLGGPRADDAIGLLRAAGGRLPLTPLGRLELFNALRLAAFRGQIRRAQAGALAAAALADLAAGTLYPSPSDWFERAEMLSEAHTAELGTRSLDVLHVASALALGADTLLTFDRRQAALARAAGLRVRPA